MTRFAWIPACVLVLAGAATATAQHPSGAFNTNAASPDVTTTRTLTPEMWFYEQERSRHDDPAQAVRRNAELRAQQRAERLASQKWFGISNSRPSVNPTPSMGGMLAPTWGSNTYDPCGNAR
jgi:hypothetical protein